MLQDIFHVHTYRCGHAENTGDEAYIKKAVELGAASITFTDHAPFPGDPFGNRMPVSQLQEYLDTLQELKKIYRDKIHVRVGLEVEYLPGFGSYYEELAADKRIELLMIGQHFFETEPGAYSFSLKEQGDVEYKGCTEAMIQGIETGLFQVVAHPDRVFRRQGTWNESCSDMAETLFRCVMEHPVLLERNISSMYQENYYRKEFWDQMPSGIRTIYGTDAHSVEQMEERYRIIRKNNNRPFAVRLQRGF